MYAVTLLWAVLSYIAVRDVWMQETDYEYYEEQTQNCSITETIRGGNVSYTQGGTEGSMLIYHCGVGRYPFPVSHRLCSADGEWSTMRLGSGRQVSQATCKEVLCPAQLELGNGDLWPRSQWLRPGENQSFSCYSGFTLSGSAQRICTSSGDWTGSIPVCDNEAEDCKDPGVPPGALRSVGRFRTGEKVQYHCQKGLDLLGSAERVCLDSKEWSGSEPRCQAAYAFDSPNAVAQAMGGSLAGVMDVLSSEFKKTDTVTFGRTLRVADGRMNVFILMDTSGSITKTQFEKARRATAELIRKLDSYEVKMKFHLTSYASQAKDIVSITDFSSDNVDRVVDRLMEFDHTSHGKQTGTNLHSALHRVYEMMSFLKQNKINQFNETQNVILIETDGHSNTGPSALDVLAKIRSLLDYSSTAKDHTDEQLLDVYVFGIGDKVNKQQLNAIASRKRKEEHIFILQDYEHLGEVFNSMISDTSVIMCGVAQEVVSKDNKAYTQPWHVRVISVSTTGELPTNCQGSIVAQNWILTAAHCFSKQAVKEPEIVTVKHGEGEVKASAVILHTKYNVKGLQHKNVPEFYDYDIALVKVNEGIRLSWKARPICLPCTKPASRAMKMSPNSTCEQHKNTLLPLEENRAYFISDSKSQRPKRKQTHIQTGSKRPSCIKPAENTLKTAVDVPLDEYVPDRFLCSGGSESHQDAVTCKGDSGGSLFLLKKLRYFQVGVVSWGTENVCKLQDRSDNPPPDARDFHISLFSLMPWLKEYLGKDMDFSSMDN